MYTPPLSHRKASPPATSRHSLDDLAQAGDPARIADLAAVSVDFEDPWVAWNIARTTASTAALGFLGYALLLHGRATSTP